MAGWLRIVVGNPFADGLPRWLDGFKGLDVEGGIRGRKDIDDGFPNFFEAEEKFNFCGTAEGVDGPHDAVTACAQERIGTPDPKDEVTPKRAHGAGGDLLRWRDYGWFRCGLFCFGGVPAWQATALI